MEPTLKAPFPYFGGKSSTGNAVWRRFGNCDTYIEPFAGSCATLLARPDPTGREIVNDMDGFLTNFWRAVKHDPEAVADHADWPVNEIDLTSRHYALVQQTEALAARLMGDPDYYDAKVAGWWVWGASQWIGGGWCNDLGKGPWTVEGGRMVRRSGGVKRKRPELDHARGVQANRPDLLHYHERGIGAVRDIMTVMGELSTRLRSVAVCCGDWQRVLSPGILTQRTAVFLDPPYDQTVRDPKIYGHETVCSDAVREWALAHPKLKIALCGYAGEHSMLGWEEYAWKANGGYGNRVRNQNRKLERIWFSPACTYAQTSIF